MSAEPARASQQFDEVLDQMTQNHRAAIDATRAHLAEVPQQGRSVNAQDLGQLPVGPTPHQAGKDLVHKYGRETTPVVERTPAREPEP
ncbi:MAG: hypothetical protein Q8K78_17775 [Planctomycetaceae bacterium]|nr:hypothetical protein [Planctomycetaceae bacterium]